MRKRRPGLPVIPKKELVGKELKELTHDVRIISHPGPPGQSIEERTSPRREQN